MARELRKQEVADAVKQFAARENMTVSSNEKGFTIMPGDFSVYMDSLGKLACTGPDVAQSFTIKNALSEIIMEAAVEAPKSPNLPAKANGKITSRSQAGNVPGSALDAVRECQSTEKATYSTGGTRKAASAKTNIAALMEAGGSLEVVKRIHNIDYIEIVGRATLGDRQVDSSRSFYKQEYLAKKAWEWIIKVLIKDPGIVVGTDVYGMPEFREGAIIKVRISDDAKNSFLVELPAKIALWREMAREWQAAGRVCETVAYSRACDMILRCDFQSKEELAEEQAEVDGIQNPGVPQ